jgi:glycosyltransferase involved in cell wall biosynthesis/SAM-dependent methyltransferase
MTAAAAGSTRPAGVNLVGFLRAEFGQGEVARRLASALELAAIPYSTINHPTNMHREAHDFALSPERDAPYDTNLLCLNAEHLLRFADGKRREILDGRYSLGVWFWETSEFPDHLLPAFDLVDEVWAASDFVANTMRLETWKPVRTFPLPVEVRRDHRLSRTDLGLPPDRFIFLFSFDFLSTTARKNPLGLVHAFRHAFEPGSGPILLLKSINAKRCPQDLSELEKAAAGHPDIQLSDSYVTQEHMQALTAACDCYVSLHRSEGFGLGLAEAMAYGKPAIATGYSGNLEFMHESNSYLVSYQPAPVPPGAGPYPEGATWADPDVEDAARLMREVVEDPDQARERAERGRATIEQEFSVERAAAFLRERLAEIHARSSQRPEPRTHAERAIRFVSTGPRVRWSAPSRFGALGGWWRAGLGRALRPYTSRQREFESAVANALVTGERRLNELEDLLGTAPYVADPDLLRVSLDDGVETIGYAEQGATARSFEEVFLGSEDRVRDGRRPYLALIGDRRPVLDLSSGRGELLDLLAEAGVPASGVEQNAALVARSRQKGHEVVEQEALKHLSALPEGHLGAVFASGLVEHLDFDDLERLLTLARRALATDGVLIVETINPHSIAGFKTFWTDPRRRAPLFPEVAVQLCRIAGFASAYTLFPGGAGTLELDRRRQPLYAVVASKGTTSA